MYSTISKPYRFFRIIKELRFHEISPLLVALKQFRIILNRYHKSLLLIHKLFGGIQIEMHQFKKKEEEFIKTYKLILVIENLTSF